MTEKGTTSLIVKYIVNDTNAKKTDVQVAIF